MELEKEKMEKFDDGEISLAELFDATMRQEAALIYLGYTLCSQGRVEDAAKLVEDVTAMDAGISHVFGLLGAIYRRKEEYDAAVKRYTDALMLEPNDTYCLANRGEILLRQGKFQEAATDLIKAMEADPERKHPSVNRARLLVALAQDAVKELEREKRTA